jgi:hypothetical protein
VQLFSGKAKAVHPLMAGAAVAFAAYFAIA